MGGPKWLFEFLAGGVLGGLGMVLTFLPILVIFCAIPGFMEDTGYMARAAYLTDRWMHMMGLHHFVFEDEHVPFIMELPLYHLPNYKTIGIYIWENILGFLQKAGSTILVALMIVWVLAYFPGGNIMNSYLGMVGQFLEPVGRWMGLPWPVLVALLTSFVAKENTVATLGILYGGLSALPTMITPAAALAFLVFQILFIPCVGTVAAMRQETRSIKWTAFSLSIMFALSLALGVLVYQVGRLI